MKDIYLQFTGPNIKGESQDKDHSGWIECTSWFHSIIQPKSPKASTSGGHTSARTTHQAMVFSKEFDISTPLLMQYCSGGQTFGEVTVDFMRADGEGNRVKYLQTKMKNVMIYSVAPRVTKLGTMAETFSLKYAAIQWTYTQQKISGGQAGNAQGAWSLVKNDKIYSV
jgi:type VI secretion system secreted protein Hcp